MKWKSLLMPRDISFEEIDKSENHGRIIVEPLERGWGSTLGNALRRIMLSSLQGAAVSSVKIEGVQHEYSTLPGVKEDVTDIIMNIKRMNLKLIADGSTELVLDVSGEGDIKASDIEDNPDVEILNPDLHIASINEEAKLKISMKVTDGKGYVPADSHSEEDDPNAIRVDSIYAPVKKVHFDVENTRVGQRTDLDKLTLDVWTDGSITTREAVGYAAKLMYDHCDLLIHIEGDLEPHELDRPKDPETDKLRQLLSMKVDELELSVRSYNCLKAANIQTLGDLVRNEENDMLKYKNFGRKSLIELNQVLANLNLQFGMDVDSIMNDYRE